MERISKFLPRLPILAILLFLAGIGMLSLLFATTPGVGVTPDSVVYFDLARNISDGRGFVATNCEGKETPTTRFPPLFPALLALFGKAGIAPVLGARWLNLLLFGANILLVGLILRRYTNTSLYPAALGSFFMLSSPAMVETHSTTSMGAGSQQKSGNLIKSQPDCTTLPQIL